jgi:hypothetical protein
MNKKETLHKTIEETKEQFNILRDKLSKLEEQYKEYDIQDTKDKYTNTYWVYRNNSYSLAKSEDDFWDEFYFIKNVDNDGDIEALKFYLDKNDKLEIKQEIVPKHYFDYFEQIDQFEIQEAWNIVLNKLLVLTKINI